MPLSRRRVRSALIALLILVCAGSLHAQTYQGGLRGLVKDAAGVIPSAEVTLVNEETNAARTVVTNEVGEYAFTSVLPGLYTVRVSLPGFRTGAVGEWS